MNLFIISGLIFLLIITNISQLYELIPNEYQISFSIVILISCVKLYDNLLGNNNSILFNSDYYRLVLAIGVFLAGLAFVLNILAHSPFLDYWGGPGDFPGLCMVQYSKVDHGVAKI